MVYLALPVIAAAIVLMVRRVEVRLVLLGAGLVLALLAGQPLLVADTFTRAMINPMVAPICAAMGFAAVMAATGCDRHLVHLLLAPVRRVRYLVVPGGILVAYLVNMAVPSQTSTAAALGPILVPLLLASGYSAEVAGAALILGASYGGDLLNPGSQDVQAVAGVAGLSASALSARVIPASIAGALTAALVFPLLNRLSRTPADGPVPAVSSGPVAHATSNGPVSGVLGLGAARTLSPDEGVDERIDYVRAVIPLVPIALLLLAYGGFPPMAWLVDPGPLANGSAGLANALPVVRAMLIGSLLAAAVGWRELSAMARSLFEGMGNAYAGIISLTITAQCFGAGIAAVGVSEALLGFAAATGSMALLAGAFPWALAALSGSGSGPVLAFAQAFLSHVDPSHDPVTLGAVSCFAGAFGRTMSPVAAVVVYSAGLVGLSPVTLVRRLLPALLAGAVITLSVVLVGPR